MTIPPFSNFQPLIIVSSVTSRVETAPLEYLWHCQMRRYERKINTHRKASQYMALSNGAFSVKTLVSLSISTLGSDGEGENAGAISFSTIARSRGWRSNSYRIQNATVLIFA